MTELVIQGICGRMGAVLREMMAARKDCRIVAGVDTAGCAGLPYPVAASLELLENTGDVLIDFSHPEATREALLYCSEKKLSCVICTTGLDEDTLALLHKTAESSAVFYSANMSLGINLLRELSRRAAALLPGFDIEIIEKHHHNKLDAPSGTALLLADAINDELGGHCHYVFDRTGYRKARETDEIGIHAVRGGSIVGEHEVLFAGPDEVVTLGHSAASRNVFASGAIAAALFLHGKQPGLYSMQDMMETL